MFKVNNKDISFENISHLVPVFLLLTLNIIPYNIALYNENFIRWRTTINLGCPVKKHNDMIPPTGTRDYLLIYWPGHYSADFSKVRKCYNLWTFEVKTTIEPN